MLESLRTIAALLHKYQQRRAAELDPLIAWAEHSDPRLPGAVCGDELWAEEDGLWDSGPQVLQRPQHDPLECRRDELAFRAAFLDLAAAIEATGAGDALQRARVAEVAGLFRAWNDAGL